MSRPTDTDDVAHRRPTGASKHRANALVCAGCLATIASIPALGMGCDRVTIERLGAVGEVDRTEPVTLSVALRERYFDSVSQALTQPTIEATTFEWAGGEAGFDRPDGTRVSLIDLGATFAPSRVALGANDDGDGLTLRIEFDDPGEQTSTIRFVDAGGNLGLCRVTLALGQRDLEVDLTPVAPEGRATLSPTIVDALSRDDTLMWSPAEPCPEDLDALDWPVLSEQVDALLLTAVEETYLDTVVIWLDDQLSLPAGAVRFGAAGERTFDPVSVDLLYRAPAEGDFANGLARAGDGFTAAFVSGFRQSDMAACVEGLELDLPATEGLDSLQSPLQTPSGEAYAALVTFDRDYLERLLGRLLLAGHACADLRTNSVAELPPLSLFVPGIDDVSRSTGFNFGDDGYARLQPLAPLSLEVVDARSLRWTFEHARVELYAESDDALVRLAEVVGTFSIDTEVRTTNSGVLSATVVASTADVERADLAVLERVGIDVDPGALAQAILETTAGRLTQVQLPRPFDLVPELLAFETTSGALRIYVDLVPP